MMGHGQVLADITLRHTNTSRFIVVQVSYSTQVSVVLGSLMSIMASVLRLGVSMSTFANGVLVDELATQFSEKE
jgi:hypothetical protein